MTSPKEILLKYWGFSSFRPLQEEIIMTVIDQKDTITLLPTGGGKSICFQIPALSKDGVCLVISPLLALMKDQVENLTKKGIKAITIKSGSSQEELITLFDTIKFGGIKFLYISPERLQSRFIQEKIKELNINLIAVDEAHCISEWGHDFRPSYRNIKILKDLKPEVNFIALTATANQKVIADISENLVLENPKIFKKSFYRDNLAYQIFKIEDKLQRLLQIFSKTKTPAIVYTNSRKKTKEIATFLNKNRFKSSYYHGGLSVDEKKTAFNNWMSEKTPIIVATNAFGMGIDKANVGLVIHYNLPFSIENYVQEAGRAGRNDKKAFAVLLYNSLDISLFKEQTALSTPTIKQIKAIHRALYQYFRISLGEISLESFSFNLLEFSKKYNYAVSLVDTVIKVLSNHGILEIDNNFNRKSTVKFIVSSNSVLNYMNNNTLLSKTINTILRTYGGLFEQESTINEFVIAKKVGTNSVAIINNLKQLHIDKIIDYKPVIGEATITFLVPREDDRSINQNLREIKSLIRQKVKKSEELLHFIENNTICRSKQILHYFDETKTTDCGLCDVCINRKHSSNKDVSIKITALLETNQNLTSQEISRLLSYKEKDILIHLRSLVSDEKISINHQNKYQLNI